jgi:glycosyltransferase involved in cell wall biosynthesis
MMPKITAIIHTSNDELRLGRALDSLRACDEVIVVDHGSNDKTERIARDHGAEFKKGIPGVDRGTYAVDARHDWILCLCANESIGEPLEAALFEWKSKEHDDQSGYNIRVREETEQGWKSNSAETRLVNRKRMNWTGDLPPTTSVFETVGGDLLRFHQP